MNKDLSINQLRKSRSPDCLTASSVGLRSGDDGRDCPYSLSTDPKSPKVAGLLLAAGQSKRLGYPKQTIAWKNQLTLLEVIGQKLLSTSIHSLWITVNDNDQILQIAQGKSPHVIPLNTIENKGMGASLKKGLRSILDKFPDLDGCLVASCDQIFVDTADFQNMLDASMVPKQENILFCSSYGSHFGIPCLIPKLCFADFLSIPDEVGAKALLQRYHRKDPSLQSFCEIQSIDLPLAAIDIDTEEDLAFARNLLLREPAAQFTLHHPC